MVNATREFYASFPEWKTASDYEKVVHICKWIIQADDDDDAATVYDPVVN